MFFICTLYIHIQICTDILNYLVCFTGSLQAVTQKSSAISFLRVPSMDKP